MHNTPKLDLHAGIAADGSGLNQRTFWRSAAVNADAASEPAACP